MCRNCPIGLMDFRCLNEIIRVRFLMYASFTRLIECRSWRWDWGHTSAVAHRLVRTWHITNCLIGNIKTESTIEQWIGDNAGRLVPPRNDSHPFAAHWLIARWQRFATRNKSLFRPEVRLATVGRGIGATRRTLCVSGTNRRKVSPRKVPIHLHHPNTRSSYFCSGDEMWIKEVRWLISAQWQWKRCLVATIQERNWKYWSIF